MVLNSNRTLTPVYLRYTGVSGSSQRSYIYVLTENSKSKILNFPLKHKYTISVYSVDIHCLCTEANVK